MNVTASPGIAAAWSASKTNPGEQAAQLAASQQQAKAERAPEDAPRPKKGPPAPEGQGTRVDVRV
jgi:hypothetical protein